MNSPDRPPKPADRSGDRPPLSDASAPLHDVRTLVGEGREAVIVHKGESYRLRITANDKLILTK